VADGVLAERGEANLVGVEFGIEDGLVCLVNVARQLPSVWSAVKGRMISRFRGLRGRGSVLDSGNTTSRSDVTSVHGLSLDGY
jgi:hypothetical protein